MKIQKNLFKKSKKAARREARTTKVKEKVEECGDVFAVGSTRTEAAKTQPSVQATDPLVRATHILQAAFLVRVLVWAAIQKTIRHSNMSGTNEI